MIKKLITFLSVVMVVNNLFAADILVETGDVLSGAPITISQSGFIENHGIIDTDIYIDDRREVFIKNYGEFKANVYLGEDANVVQIISGADNANAININERYTVQIENATDVPFDVVARSVSTADKITIKDSNLIVSDVTASAGAPIMVIGQVNLYIDDVNNIKSGPILSNVVGTGNINVVIRNPDNKYVYNPYLDGGNLFVNVERETDEDKVYDDPQIGDFVEDLRGENKDDNILDDLDSATDISTVINKSARFNPNVLRRPLQIIHTLDMNDVVNYDSGVNVRPWGVFGTDFDSYGADINFAYSGNRVRISLGARVGKVEYVNTLDEFDAAMYGINMDAEYDVTDSVFANLDMGVMLTQFNIGDVLHDGHRYHNPDGVSGYAAMDVGYRLVNESGIYVAPMFGVVGEYYKIEGFNTFDSAIRTGFGAGYLSEMFGIKYEYGFNVSAGTNEYLYAGLHAGVVSTMDMIGGDINVGIVRMFDTITYTISATAKLLF